MKLNLNKNKTYLLACSFGPDSMALFHMLKTGGYHFGAALVNYHLREESNFEMDSFKDYCQKCNIKCHVLDLTSKPTKGNIENECRKIRYQFFADLMKKYHFDSLLVAHHQDDHIETYLMQKDRKNLVKFYGISENTTLFGINVKRPLLDYSKQQLLEYCYQNNVPYSIDKTNLHNDYRRNQIRHEIVEKISIEERKRILDEISYKNYCLKCLLDSLTVLKLDSCEVLLGLDDKELAYALNLMSGELNISLSMKQCREIRKILESKKSNISLFIKRDIYFEKSYSSCCFIKKENSNFSFVLEKPSVLDNEYFFLDFTGDTSNRNVCLDDYPLTIRTAKKDDVVTIKNYKVKVSRLFIDWKMPLSLRRRWPIITNKNGDIIYIPRYQKDFVPDSGVNFYVK